VGNQILIIDDFGDVITTVDAGSVQGVSGDLLPTQVPGIFINPNTGAVIDLTSSSAAGGGQDQASAQAFQAAEAEKDRAFKAEQDRIAREEARRQNLLSIARDLVQSQIGERSRAQTQSVELAGDDPFRFLGQIHGQAVGNTKTPYDIFKDKLGTIATAQVPNITGNESIADLESAIQKLQGMQQQPVGAGIGFAQGGTTPMPGPLQARLIGEAGSVIAPGTEVLITGGGQATVLPLGPGMQQGGLVDTDLGQVNLGVVPQLFDRLRKDIYGLGGPSGGSYSQLGYLEPNQAAGSPQLGAGYGALASPLDLRPGYSDLVKAGVISQKDADTIINAIGLLPSPRKAAMFLRSLTPVEKEAVVSLYKLAGIPENELGAMLESATITGPQRQAVRYAA
jgi:hypothetical protein